MLKSGETGGVIDVGVLPKVLSPGIVSRRSNAVQEIAAGQASYTPGFARVAVIILETFSSLRESLMQLSLRLAKPALMLALFAALTACSEKTEEQQLAALRKGMIYHQYRGLSENGLRIGLFALAKSMDFANQFKPEAQVRKLRFDDEEICFARLILAYSALSTGKNTIALAETDITSEGNCAQVMKAGAGTLRSVIFQRKKWPTLAAKESDHALKLMPPSAKGMSAEEQMLVFHAVLGLAALQDGKLEQATVHTDAISLLLKNPWLGKLLHAVVKIKTGEFTAGLRDIKRISEDPLTPADLRIALGKEFARIEAKTGDIDSAAFQARIFGIVLWQALKEHSPKYAVMITYAENQISQQVDQGVAKTKGVLDAVMQKTKEIFAGD